MLAPEKFLLRELATLEADLDRFQRMLDGLRRLTMNEHSCSDIEAELHLQQDRTWKQLRRQQAAARRSWLSFHRALEKHRKAHPAPESDEDATQKTTAAPHPCAPAHQPPPAPMPAPQPEPAPIL